ncbi:MAG: 4-hydroxybenzoate polyprenyltransferase [Frankiales bacterium]|nr:4-hydroxybenzoate polyprenyltransferase [Frankiales bacterium]
MTAEAIAAPRSTVRRFLRLVMIEHSVFALPFAYIAALTAMFSLPRLPMRCPSGVPCPGVYVFHWRALLLITVAMVAARTFAMAANRIIDRRVDGLNPRTANRELVTGALPVRAAVIGAGVALVGFLAAAALLNPLSLALAPLALIPLTLYSYAKRVTWAPHAVLALAQAVAPIGAWIGVTGRWSWHAVVLGVAVGLWIGGFDVIYALQDRDADIRNGVKSVPARFGVRASLHISSWTHVVTMGLFAWFGTLEHFGIFWWIGLGITAVAFVYEHSIVKSDDQSRINRAFFTANGFIGIALFLFAVADLVHRGLRP